MTATGEDIAARARALMPELRRDLEALRGDAPARV